MTTETKITQCLVVSFSVGVRFVVFAALGLVDIQGSVMVKIWVFYMGCLVDVCASLVAMVFHVL